MAGEAIEDLRRRGVIRTHKADHSPVTEADLVADRLITQGLAQAQPGVPILSEESSWVGEELGDEHDAAWCVDPIDGTEAFLDPRTRGYAVQIARLARGDDGVWRPTLGVVFEPAYRELFFAHEGRVGFERSGVAVALPMEERRRDADPRPRLVTSTRAPQELRRAMFARGYGDAGTLRSVGVKVGHLVKGEAEVYSAAPALAYWDLAAPQAILEAAGGTVSDADGAPVVYALDEGRTHVEGPTLLTLRVDHQAALADLRDAVRELGYLR